MKRHLQLAKRSHSLSLSLSLILLVFTGVVYAQSGNVGIGESQPGSKGSIKGNLSVGAAYSGISAPADGAIIEGKVGIGTVLLDGSAKLQIEADNGGILIPRMTIVKRNAISNPATGLLIYQTDNTSGFYYNSGTPASPQWVLLTNANSAVNNVNVASPITNTGNGTNPVIGIQPANTFQDGYLSSTDWNTFNSKQTSMLSNERIWIGDASGIAQPTPVTGDITISNAGVTTLSASGVSAGTYGGATIAPVITVDAKGRITSVSTVSITDNNTIYTAGTGITLSGNAFSHTAHTGDVTGATALTIASDAVTNAKLSNMAQNTIKGRKSTGSGDPEDLTATEVKTILGLSNATIGTGTTNYVSKWTSDSTLGNSQIFDDGTKVGIGTNNPQTLLHLQNGTSASQGVLVESTSGNSGGIALIEVRGKRDDNNKTPAFAGGLYLSMLHSTGAITNTANTSNENLGIIAFGGNHTNNNAGNILYPASISGIAEGSFTNSTTMPTALVFRTSATGKSKAVVNDEIGTERMRITSSGNVGIGASNPQSKLHVEGSDVILTRILNPNLANSGSVFLKIGKELSAGNQADIQYFHNGNGSTNNYLGFGFHSTNPILAVTYGGKVGIGTTDPKQALHIVNDNYPQVRIQPKGSGGSNVSLPSGIDFWATFDNFPNDQGARRTATIKAGYAGGVWGNEYMSFRVGGAGDDGNEPSEKVRILANGNVGINTATPKARLHVAGTTSGAQYSPRYFNHGNASLQYSSASYWPISIYSEGNILTSDAVIATNNVTFSDERIKNIVGISNNTNDLDIINKIKITDYYYIDTIGHGNKIVKKVIAQQVEKVYPQAVQQNTYYIPNIYSVASKVERTASGTKLFFEEAKTIKKGSVLKLVTNILGEEIVKCEEVTNDYILIDKKLTSDSVFIYGEEVNDFRVVDYDALSMLNISATQELAKKIAVLEKENTLLKEENTHTKMQNSELNNLIKGMKTQLDAINERLNITGGK